MKRILPFTAMLLLLPGCASPEPKPQLQPFVMPSPAPPTAPAEPEWSVKSFKGDWDTVRNLRLSGDLTCTITRLGNDKWRCDFDGSWFGGPFDYSVTMTGPLDNLVGDSITIDGASYEWTASVVNGVFSGTFESWRYKGSFAMNEI